MQIQFLGRGWRYHSTNKAAWLCAFCKLTSQPSRRCFRLSAAKESTGIPALIRQQEPVADFSATLRCLFPPRSLQPLLRSSCGLAWCATSLRSLGRTKQTQRAAPQPYLTTARSASSKYWLASLRPLDTCPCLCRPRYVLFDPVSLDKSTWVRTPASLQQATNTNEWYSCGIVRLRRRLETWVGFAATSAGLELRPGRYLSAPPALQPPGCVGPLPRAHPAAPRRLPALTNHVPFSSAIKVQLKYNTTTTP